MVRGRAQGGGIVLPTAGAIVLSTLALTLLTLFNLEDVSSRALTHDAFRLGAAALFVAAGILRLARWRLTGQPHSALVAASLFVLGALALPLGNLAGQVVPGGTLPTVAAVTHAVGSLLCIGLTLRALTGSGPRPLVGLAVGTPVLALSLLGVGVLAGLVLAACWIVAGLAAARLDVQKPWAGRMAPLLGSMGLVEVLGSLEHLQPGSWTLPATALLASVAMIATQCAYVDLVEARPLGGTRPSTTGPAVSWSLGPLGSSRSATPDVREGRAVDFGVTGVVASVADRHRLSGQEVRVRGGAGVAHARPADLVAALDELLGNARRYAPGCPVTVQVVAIGSRVEVSVSDRGPGLAAGVVDRALEAGLGLSVARELVRRNGGDLELRTRIGGATFVVSLPASTSAPHPRPAEWRTAPSGV
jgi:hypothetical protein